MIRGLPVHVDEIPVQEIDQSFDELSHKLQEVNTSPNNPQVVSSNFVLTYVLSETAKLYESQGRFQYLRGYAIYPTGDRVQQHRPQLLRVGK